MPDIKSLTFKQLRSKTGMTQGELAQILGVSKNTVWNYENGGKIPESKMSLILSVFNMYNQTAQKEKQINLNKFNNEGRIVNDENKKLMEFFIIPGDAVETLEKSYYDRVTMNKLKKEIREIKKAEMEAFELFKIEITGSSMDDSDSSFHGSKASLVKGDWAYCASIPKYLWREMPPLNLEGMFCFFHNTHGIIFKKVKDQNLETGEIRLYSLNKDKKEFPDIAIKLAECSYVLCVIEVLSSFSHFLAGNVS